VETFIGTPQLFWAHTLDLRLSILGAEIRACAGYARLCARLGTRIIDKPGGYSALGSQHVCTIALVSAECVAPGRLQSGDTENGMSCALDFLATRPEI
jgi:hypothetical protein